MAIEIVDFPIKNGDFPLLCESSPEGMGLIIHIKIKHPLRNHGWVGNG